MKTKPLNIHYVARPDATPEREVPVLAAVYKLILDSAGDGEATESSGRDDSPTEDILAGGNAE